MPTASIVDRLRAAGVADTSGDPLELWQRLRAAEGPTVTLIELYAIVAAPRGLAPHELDRTERLGLARALLPLTWPGFELAAGSDRPLDPIELSPPDPGWPARYREWEMRIRAAVGVVARRVDHVGSTSVPGLSAKPTVDIQVSVDTFGDESSYAGGLESIGLALRSRDELHRFFRPAAGLPRDVHVHVCPSGSVWEHDHLLFRDYLRTHPAARDEYAAVKRAAALTWADDRLAYTDAKTGVVLRLLAAAEAWQRSSP